MELTVFTGRANPDLANLVAQRLGKDLGKLMIEPFPDGELHIDVQESVRSHDVYIVQPTSPPTAENLLEIFLTADACHRAGASRVTAVTPYFGYARQDRRVTGREPVSARLIADLFYASHVDRVVTLDLHNPTIEGFFSTALEHLSAIPILASAARNCNASIIVSPDLGGAKLAERYGTLLGLPVAIVHKARISGEEVSVQAIVGDVRGRRLLIVDDMISTGGTMEAAVRALLTAGCDPAINLAATHGLLVGSAVKRLERLPLQRIYLTNSVARPSHGSLPVQEVDLSSLLAEAIRRLYEGKSLGELLMRV